MSIRFVTVLLSASALVGLSASTTRASCPFTPPAGCQLVTAPGQLPRKIDSCFYIEGATGSPHTYRMLNVLAGGALHFVEKADETTDFRVSGLLVEKGGLVQAGSADCPYGSERGVLEIGLWGDDPTNQGKKTTVPPGKEVDCLTNPTAPPNLRCFPATNSDGSPRSYGQPHYCTVGESDDPCSSTDPPESEPKNALLEPYGTLNFDTTPWGYKTIGVAYGGSLLLYGYKGAKPLQDPDWKARYDSDGSCIVPTRVQSDLDPGEMRAWARLTGSSWARLQKQDDSETDGFSTLTFDRPLPDWKAGDQIVVGATDWHPSHSELREIREVLSQTQVRVDLLKYPHYATIFDAGLPDQFTNAVNRRAVDTRAVVGLLTRSIRVYSRGDKPIDDFPPTADCTIDKGNKEDCYFGGHLIVRQGFRQVQIQGVEFKQLGQGGRMGHYPVHFHLAKSTAYAPGTFVKDSSVWDSMTRFVVVHGTHEVNVSRNVGFLSLGHGYYIEDASEIRNQLCHNLGVSARAGLQQYVTEQAKPEHWCGGAPPPAARLVPPILDGTMQNAGDQAADTATGSDTYMPVMYWAMNAYNEFVGNAAVGVHGFGSCFWLLGSAVSGPSIGHQFDGFASYNAPGRQAPLLRFRGNTCTTSPLALPSTREIAPGGNGFAQAINTGYSALENPYLTNGAAKPSNFARPIINGSFQPMLNGTTMACAAQASPGVLANNTQTCLTTVIDRFATSFNWAEVNFGSIWLRPWYYLFSNGAVTDQIGGGLGFVTGGDWTQALPAYLALAQNGLFVGTTQPTAGNLYAKRSGPDFEVTATTSLSSSGFCGATTCNFPADGTGLYHGGFNPKRLLTIYDGPTYADGNAFLNVGAWECNAQPCASKSSAGQCDGAANGEVTLPCGIYTSTTQPASPKNDGKTVVVLDAGIGWKQPNGFYYPPAFTYRRNAFLRDRIDDLNNCFTEAPGDYVNATFKPGSCRHNVIDRTATYMIGNMIGLNAPAPTIQSGPQNQLDSGTIDFATILLDLDGSLTGSTSKIDGRTPPGLTTSLSKNRFFDAPAQSPECLSFGLQTSPYTFLTTSVGRLVSAPSATTNAIAKNDSSGGNPAWPPSPAVAIYRNWKLESDEGKTCGQVCDGGNYGCERASFMGMASQYQSPFLTMTQPPALSDQQPGTLYYVDTNSGAQSTSCVRGQASLRAATFRGNDSYVLYNIFPQADSISSYQLYVGDVADNDLGAIDFRYVRVFVHEIDGAGRQTVSEPCDPRQATGWCVGAGTRPTLKDGILTVVLDHPKLLGASAFSIASRAGYEQCMPRDLCYFDAGTSKCKSCLTADAKPASCLRTGDFLARDVKVMNAASKSGTRPLDSVCEDWATLVSGQVKIGGDDVTSADCPNGGCLGVAFRLPNGFQPRFYQTVDQELKLSRCFLQSAWVNDALQPRMDGDQAADPQCGAPRMLDPADEFCTDPALTLVATSSGPLAAPSHDGAVARASFTVDGDASGAVVAFDADAIDSFLAGGAFRRATLELTLAGTAAPALVDVLPLRREDAAAAGAGRPTAPPARIGGAGGAVASWDVTADVLAGAARWEVRGRDGGARFYSSAAATAAGDPDLAPRLVLE